MTLFWCGRNTSNEVKRVRYNAVIHEKQAINENDGSAWFSASFSALFLTAGCRLQAFFFSGPLATVPVKIARTESLLLKFIFWGERKERKSAKRESITIRQLVGLFVL